MKQGCVLAPTLFGAFFAEAFEDTAEGNYLRTKPDGMLFNISTLKQIPNEISAWSPLCQLTMQPSPPTQPKTLSSSWTISARPAKTLHWPPAWKIKTQVMAPNASTYLPAVQSWSLNWRLSMTAYIIYNGKYQNPGLQSQQFEHTAVKQRVLESSRTTGEEA